MKIFKKEIYDNYVSKMSKYMYKNVDKKSIFRNFPVWDVHYLRYFPEDKNIKILELGCGNGGFMLYLKEKGYKNVFGVEISKEQISMAKKFGINGIILQDLVYFLKKTKEKYDVIVMRDVLEHFGKKEITLILKQVHRVLRAEGILVLQVPNAEGLFGGRYRYGDFTHEIAFTGSSLSTILRIAGFDEIKCYPSRPVAHSVASFIRYILWFFLNFKTKIYMLIETGGSSGIFTQNIISIAKKAQK